MTIANSGHDERGQYHGGQAGDQTGKEWYVRSWYNRPWNAVARFSTEKGKDIAVLAKNAANNDKIGYDQYQRTTFWNQLKKAKDYDPKNITTACEADCSAGVAAIVKAVGYRKNDTGMKNVSENLWTGIEVEQLRKAGAKILTDSKYLTSDKYLKAGDILINSNHHTAINLTNGSGITDKTSTSTATKTTSTSTTKYKVIAKSGLNCREKASTSSAVKKIYKYGTIVAVSASENNWAKTPDGWVSMKYLEKA